MTEARPDDCPSAASTESSAVSDVCFSFLVGFVLAILQFSYFFLLEVHLTSRSISFFVAMFFWLVGFLIGLNLRGEKLFIRLLVGGVVAYYVAMGLATFFPFNKYVLPVLGICIAVSGLVPGYFFPYARNRFRWIGNLFFHENNGFLLGIIVSLLSAVFAGKWLLTWAPALGLLLVLGVLQYQRWCPPRKHVRVEKRPLLEGQTAFPLFSVGLHLGILQAALFFIVQVYVTATYMGYFVIVLAWMLGVVINMKTALPKSVASALAISMAAYYGMLFIAGTLAPYGLLIPIYFALTIVAAQPAGAFFRELAGTISARSLFLHENNGFILGLLLSMFGFVKWGVHFLYIAPLLSLALALLSASAPARRIFLFLPAATFVFVALGNVYGFVTMLVVCLVGALSCFIGLRPPEAPPQPQELPPPHRFVARALPRLLLAIAGCNLLLLQFFITREFSSVLAASELTILMVSTAYFTGISVGYAFSHCLPQPLLRFGAVCMFFLHMLILLFAKVCAGYLIHAGYGLPALIGLLLIAAFATSSLYSLFLPRLVQGTRGLSLIGGYTWDLVGAIGGVVIMFACVRWAPEFLWPLYFLLMLVMLAILFKDTPWQVGVVLGGLVVIAFLTVHQADFQRFATEDYYRTRNYDHPQVVFSGNSFYHSVEVLDTFRDEARTQPKARISFINGVRYFRYFYGEDGNFSREAGLSEFTYFLAALPAQYLHNKRDRKLRILIMGGGSMQSLSRVYPYASKTTLVEVDALVIESAKTCWAELNHYKEIDNYEIVVDDAKHYLKTTNEKFDLIINDISAPYYLGTALCHGREFYELVESRLKKGGLFAESTQARPKPRAYDSQALKIIRGVADVFRHYRVVDGKGSPRSARGYIYASNDLDFSTADVTDLMKKDGMYAGTATYWEGSSRFRLHKVTPYSLGNMETLFTGNVWRLAGRLGLDDDDQKSGQFGSMLHQALDPEEPLHSRLAAAVIARASSPTAIGIGLLVLVLGLVGRRSRFL